MTGGGDLRPKLRTIYTPILLLSLQTFTAYILDAKRTSKLCSPIFPSLYNSSCNGGAGSLNAGICGEIYSRGRGRVRGELIWIKYAALSKPPIVVGRGHKMHCTW